MTPRQIALVQESWKLVQPIAGKAAELFYMRLFSLEPSVQRLFTGDMAEQGRGRRHAGYGVQKHHYAVVEAALIWTLAVGLGEKFTRETEEAWRTAYRVLANTMQSNTQERIHAGQPAAS